MFKFKAYKMPEVANISVTTDEDYPDKVEIHLLDVDGAIIEGGQFDLESFVHHILDFYSKNY